MVICQSLDSHWWLVQQTGTKCNGSIFPCDCTSKAEIGIVMPGQLRLSVLPTQGCNVERKLQIHQTLWTNHGQQKSPVVSYFYPQWNRRPQGLLASVEETTSFPWRATSHLNLGSLGIATRRSPWRHFLLSLSR